MLLCAGLLALGAGALAQTATYVFPYEGFRYTQREDETVLTQTNLGEHEALLKSLGTSSEAVLASYVASGIVMEVIPDDGGQIAVSVTDAGKFADVQDMDKMTQEQRLAFLAQFEMSGLYETCAYVDTAPACVRLTSSAMYASMPVYSLRYATLHLGKLYMIEQTIVGREPDEADDARMEQLLSGMKLLSSLGQATPTPQATATMQPTATPEPILGSAAVETSGSLTLDEIPAYTTSAQLTLSGHAAASAEIRVEESGKQLAKTGAKKDGSFSLKVKLADEGDHELVVTAGEDTATFTIRYEKAGRAAGDHRAGEHDVHRRQRDRARRDRAERDGVYRRQGHEYQRQGREERRVLRSRVYERGGHGDLHPPREGGRLCPDHPEHHPHAGMDAARADRPVPAEDDRA